MANSILIQTSRRLIPSLTLLQPYRNTTTKHYNPKFKKLRAQKVFKVDLPEYSDKNVKMSPEKRRKKMIELGIYPRRPWNERVLTITSTAGVFEPYIPPEGDGKASMVSLTRAKQAVQLLEKKTKSLSAIRKIKSYDDDFKTEDFCQQAQTTYIKAHECLASGDWEGIRDYVTEKAHPEFKHNAEMKTIRWKFIESLEPARVVHARCTDLVNKTNLFGQLTVRFHTRQTLAVYDRFGRLMHGSEILAKDVLEYIVFEKNISNMYGLWRIHDKIIPDWMPPSDPSTVTRVVADPEPVEEEKIDVAEVKTSAPLDKSIDSVEQK